MTVIEKLLEYLLIKKSKSLNAMMLYNDQSIENLKNAIVEYKELIKDAEDDIVELIHDNKEVSAQQVNLLKIMN